MKWSIKLKNLPNDSTIYLLAPIVRGRKGEYKKEILNYKKRGFTKIKVDGDYLNIDEFPNLNKKIKHEISIIVDRVILNSNLGNRLADSVETAVNLSNGLLVVEYENETLPKKFRNVKVLLFHLNFLVLKVDLLLKKLNQDYFLLIHHMEHVKSVKE